MGAELPIYFFYTMFAAICYYFYNDRMFLYINSLIDWKISVFKSRVLTFGMNYLVFMLISSLQFYLIVNWTIFAIFLVFEIALLYRCPFKMSLFCGIQGAMVGLAMNFITRSGAAILFHWPLAAFDSHTDRLLINLKTYPIALGFLLAGVIFWWMYRHFSAWADNDVTSNKTANLTFFLCLVFALFIYLDLNLLIYFVFSDEMILKLWGMKSGVCVLIGYYIGTSYIYTLARLQKFERQSYSVREELKSYQLREEKLKQAAYSDCLTGCCAREVGRQAMKKAYEENRPFYIYFVDINDLKRVNDNLGHDAGDRYIAAVAYALMNAAGEGDIVCRYGGDEFLLMTFEEGGPRLDSEMKNLQWFLEELSDTSEYPFRLWVSYGTAYSQECQNLDELMKLVDERMYAAKKDAKETQAKTSL